jgi:hypothetical protein
MYGKFVGGDEESAGFRPEPGRETESRVAR